MADSNKPPAYKVATDPAVTHAMSVKSLIGIRNEVKRGYAAFCQRRGISFSPWEEEHQMSIRVALAKQEQDSTTEQD